MKEIGIRETVSQEELSELKSRLSDWDSRARDYYSSRADAQERLLCETENGNLAGLLLKKHPADDPFPFDGASDQRVRLADRVLGVLTDLLINTAEEADVEIICSNGAAGQQLARNLTVLLRWLIAKQGANWQRQLRALCHHMIADTPAIGMLHLGWRKNKVRGIRELSADELSLLMGGEDPAFDQNFQAALKSGQTAGIEAKVVTLFKVSPKEARQIVKALAEEGACTFACVVDMEEGPVVKALRYGDDFVLPEYCTDFDFASPWFRGEWVTEAELRSRIETLDWDEAFVEEVLENESVIVFNDNSSPSYDDRKGLYNLVWAYTAEVLSDGTTARYLTVFGAGDRTACGKELVRGRKGRWPVVLFTREVASDNLIDARGVAELAAPAQGIVKTLRDASANNAIIGALPPIKSKGSSLRNVMLEPLNIISMGRQDELAFMQPPAYPAAGNAEAERILNEALDYFGIATKSSDPGVIQAQRKAFVNWWLAQYREALEALLQTAQECGSNDMLAAVTNTNESSISNRQSITGNFSLRLKLSLEDLDSEALIKKVTAFSQVLMSIDRDQSIDRAPLARLVMRRMFPDISEESMRQPQQLAEQERSDEEQNFIKIKAGIMPRMNTSGQWNFPARLAFYEELQQQNPNALADWPPERLQMLQMWVKALQQQSEQFGANADIGRTGVEGVPAMQQ